VTITFVTTDYTGHVFRCVPHGTKEPLDTSYSLGGGRWNAPGTFQVLYTFLSVDLARTWAQQQLANVGATPDNTQPERLPDLVVIDCNLTAIADLTRPAGLSSVGLPTTYPVGYETQAAWTVTQPIGAALYNQGTPGLLARSATAKAWDGETSSWAELAIFPDHAPPQVLVDRLPYTAWT